MNPELQIGILSNGSQRLLLAPPPQSRLVAALSREDAFPEDQTGEVRPASDIQAHVALGIRGDILFEKIKLEVKLTGY